MVINTPLTLSQLHSSRTLIEAEAVRASKRAVIRLGTKPRDGGRQPVS